MLHSGPNPNANYSDYAQGARSFIDFSDSPTATGRHLRLLNRAADALHAVLLRVSVLACAVIQSIYSFFLFLSSSSSTTPKRSTMTLSPSCSLPITMERPRETASPFSPTNTFAIPSHFLRKAGSRPVSRQSTNTSSRSVSASSFFKKMLSLPKFGKRRRCDDRDGKTSAQSSVLSFTADDKFDNLGDSASPASSATEVDSDDCEMVDYTSDSDDSPTTLRGASPFLDKQLAPSASAPSFSNPFSTHIASPSHSSPSLASSSPIIIPSTLPSSPPKKQPKRNPHRVHDLSDFIATRRTSALMCPPPSPGYSSSFHPSHVSSTGARRRSSCKGSFSSYSAHGGQSSPYRKYCFATEDSRHDFQPVSPKRASYGNGETQPVASLPIPPWRRYRKAQPVVGDVESRKGPSLLPAW